MSEATEAEIAQDLEERVSENPLAYQGNKMAFALTPEDVEMMKKQKN